MPNWGARTMDIVFTGVKLGCISLNGRVVSVGRLN